jgi:ATP-dependent DNA helicase DinG
MSNYGIDLREKTSFQTSDLFTEKAQEFLREAIHNANDNEVFFVGTPDSTQRIDSVKLYARGNQQAVPALINVAEPGTVIIHNHPSGNLTPSSADLEIASTLGQRGVGAYIINNEVSDCYVIVLPDKTQEPVPIDIAELAKLIEPNELFSQKFPGYEYRQQQVDMLKMVVESLNANHVSLIEAGTGTGKSLAYLIPLVRWSVTNKERCVISTNTINLQEQLIYKDIPALQQILPEKFTACLVKGRQNYICKRKLNMILQSPETHCDEDELEELYRIADWAKTTNEGSLSDLNFVPDSELWEKVCSDSESCQRAQCASFNDCFTTRARRTANAANLLIVNHHLLFADIAIKKETGFSMDTGILPRYKRIVIDEAHHIEDVATSYFGLQISQRGLIRIIRRLYHQKSKKNEKGYWVSLIKKLQKTLPANVIDLIINRITTEYIPGVAALEDSIRNAFVFMNDFIRALPKITDQRETLWRIPADKESLSNWERLVKEPVYNLRHECKTYLKEVKLLIEELTEFANVHNAKLHNELTEITAAASKLERHIVNMEWILLSSQDESPDVRWIETGSHHRLTVHSAPVNVANEIYDSVICRFPTIIMTSATLTIEENFDFLEQRLGLGFMDKERLRKAVITSPFDYKQQVFMGIPTDISDPDSEQFAPVLAEYVAKALQLTSGGTFVLFTSFFLLEQCYNYIKRAKIRDRYIMKQGDEPRHALLERFRQDKRSVLFGTNSFWEGVDVKGNALQCVILTRLPFRVPTDPVIEARVEFIKQNGGNPFMDYIIPLAVVKFRQGFGRLIRTKTDHGAVFIMDKRVLTKSYGKRFLRSLPECDTVCDTAENVLQKLESFFA